MIPRNSPGRRTQRGAPLLQWFLASWGITKPETMWSLMRPWWQTTAGWVVGCPSKSTSLTHILMNSRRTQGRAPRSKSSASPGHTGLWSPPPRVASWTHNGKLYLGLIHESVLLYKRISRKTSHSYLMFLLPHLCNPSKNKCYYCITCRFVSTLC